MSPSKINLVRVTNVTLKSGMLFFISFFNLIAVKPSDMENCLTNLFKRRKVWATSKNYQIFLLKRENSTWAVIPRSQKMKKATKYGFKENKLFPNFRIRRELEN